MKTVSQPMAQRLKEAEWEKKTVFAYVRAGDDDEWEIAVKVDDNWICLSDQFIFNDIEDVLPVPTLDEVLEELSLSDFIDYYKTTIHTENFEESYRDLMFFWQGFSTWLFTTVRSADAAAGVWLKMKGE